METPEVRYARNGDVSLAFQVVGEGPLDLVFVPGFVGNLDLMWEFRPYARFLRRLASFSRLIVMDRRGTGLSDRLFEDLGGRRIELKRTSTIDTPGATHLRFSVQT